jgi:hypothetical protein
LVRFSIWLQIGVQLRVCSVICVLPILPIQCTFKHSFPSTSHRIICICTGITLILFMSIFAYTCSTLNQGVSSHKKIPKEQSWLLRQYYGNNVVLFLFCACNELFFVSIYLLSFPPPPHSPPRLGMIPYPLRLNCVSGFSLYPLSLWMSSDDYVIFVLMNRLFPRRSTFVSLFNRFLHFPYLHIQELD